jgi:hypothetical protein
VHDGICGYYDAAHASVGPGCAFGRALLERGAARRVGLVGAACGGTNLHEQWAPGELRDNELSSVAGHSRCR